jgi:hypothetical protein
LPSAIIRPHDGFGGWMPTPRKLSDASARIETPNSKVNITMIWFERLGRISCDMICQRLAPVASDAATKSISRSRIVADRVTTR